MSRDLDTIRDHFRAEADCDMAKKWSGPTELPPDNGNPYWDLVCRVRDRVDELTRQAIQQSLDDGHELAATQPVFDIHPPPDGSLVQRRVTVVAGLYAVITVRFSNERVDFNVEAYL